MRLIRIDGPIEIPLHHRRVFPLLLDDRGRVFVLKNRARDGMALLDKAIAMAMSGELSPLVVGLTCCNMTSSTSTA